MLALYQLHLIDAGTEAEEELNNQSTISHGLE